MKILRLEAQNYRTLEDVKLTFPTPYTAICGANDCGKTNILRIIRAFMKEDNPFYYAPVEDFAVDEDFPKWREIPAPERIIDVSITIVVYPDRDAGLYQFIIRQLSLDDEGTALDSPWKKSADRSGPERRRVVNLTAWRWAGNRRRDSRHRCG